MGEEGRFAGRLEEWCEKVGRAGVDALEGWQEADVALKCCMNREGVKGGRRIQPPRPFARAGGIWTFRTRLASLCPRDEAVP